MLGWVENALTWAKQAPLEVAVKNTVGQITKEFYGYGPRTPARCLVAGRLILHMTPMAGSAVLDELADRAAGRVVMDYNNRLLVQRYRPALARLAEGLLGNELVLLMADYDEGSRQVVGAALFRNRVGADVAGGREGEAARFVDVLRAWGGPGPWEPGGGGGLLWATGPSVAAQSGPLSAQGASSRDDLEAGCAWRERREDLARRLRGLWPRPGEANVVFAGADGHTCLVGVWTGGQDRNTNPS